MLSPRKITLCFALSAAIALPGLACDGGLSKTTAGISIVDEVPPGPRVIFDPLAQPVPEVPFPNDLLLRPDERSGSGVFLNISEEATTEGARRLRRGLNTLEGFGTTAPIMVSFDAPLNLATVTNENIVVINIEPGHPRQGEVIELDLGRYFPIAMNRAKTWWGYDSYGHLPDLFFSEANTVTDDGGNPIDRIEHYEVESDTLWLRPLEPMALGAEHAVLLLDGLTGYVYDDGGNQVERTIRSPFPFKAHAAQQEAVVRGLDLAGKTTDDLVFGWTFTTADVTAPLYRLRKAVNGEGPLADKMQVTPKWNVRDTDIRHDGNGVAHEFDARDHGFILQPGVVNEILALVAEVEPKLTANMQHVDYMAFGSFDSPDVRTGDHYRLGVNTFTGEGKVGVTQVPYFVAIPKETERHKAPFPVVIYYHGTQSSRLEMLGVADSYARQGIAVVAFDQVAHGPIIPDLELILEQQGVDPALISFIAPALAEILVPHRVEEFKQLEGPELIKAIKEIGLFAEFAVHGRAEDKNGDGIAESAEAFFWADVFRLCGNFQQDMVDTFQLVKLLKGLRQENVPPAIDMPDNAKKERLMENLLAGDFNADGVLDLGGPDAWFGVAGTSLGGFHAALAAALEDEVRTATPIAGGGGFLDVMLRTSLSNVVEPVMFELLGPLVVGCPDGEGGLWLTFNNDGDKCDLEESRKMAFAHLPGAGAGGQVHVVNLDNGEEGEVEFGPDGGFSIPIPSDKWDQLEIAVTMVDGTTNKVLAQTPYEGTGLERNSPELRRMLGIGATVMDQCDPLAFAVRIFREPFEGKNPVSMLMEDAIGDTTVPLSTAMHLARAAGSLGPEEQWRPWFDEMVARGLFEGADNWDVDDILRDNDPTQAPIGPFPPVDTGVGLSSIRFADVKGHHEWIAAVNQSLPLDHATLSQNRMALFHLSGGTVISDDPCIARLNCELLEDPESLLFSQP